MSLCGWNTSAPARTGFRTAARFLGIALLLIGLGLTLDGCRKKSNGPSPPNTTFTLIGTDVATVTSGNRFGAAPPRDPVSTAIDLLSGNAVRENGASIHFSSGGAVTFYTIDQLGCPGGALTQYNPASPPTVPVATSFGQAVPNSEAWDLCYYSVAGGLKEALKRSIIYFDTLTPEVQLLDSTGVNRFAANAVPFTEFPMLKPIYNEDTTNGAVDATTLLPPGTMQVSTVPAFFAGETGTIYYTTDGSIPITPRRAAVFGLTASPSIPLVKGVGKQAFPFSSFQRLVTLVSVDDVGNESVPMALTVPLDLITTDPSAGYYHLPQDIQLIPPDNDFDSQISSAAFLRLCQYTTAAGYECATPPTLAGLAASVQVDATPADYVYLYGTNPPTNNPTFNLAGVANETTVYDLKILNDSYLGDGGAVTDADHQALFILDRDLPVLKVYADPDKSTDKLLKVGASWFDDGYFVIKEAQITDYSVTRDLTVSCTTIIDPITLLDACVKPIAPTVTLPASAFALPADNSPVNVTVTATDAAGNVANSATWQGVGRSYLEGSGAAVSANLGYAMAAGRFNSAAGAAVTTASAPDYAIAEPSKTVGGFASAGSVYIFYDDVRTQVRFDSANATALPPFVPMANLVAAAANSQITITTTVNGVSTGAVLVDLNARAFLPTPTAAGLNTLNEVADAFNKAIMSLAHAGQDLGVYMVATNHDADAQGVKDSVAIFSDSKQIDTCVTIAGGTLATLLQLPSTTQCIWDERIDGEAAGDQFGHGVAVGDFNGDGYDDLVVGAPGGNGGTGTVYIFYSAGVAGGFGEFSGAQYGTITAASANLTILGAAAGDDLGWAVGAGDLDPTGGVGLRRDLVVGAPGVSTVQSNAGRVYVLRNPATNGVALPATTLTTATAFFIDDPGINAPAAGDRYGHAVLVADIEVDSIVPSDEIVVGAPGVKFLQDTATNAGAAYYYNFANSAGTVLSNKQATGANVDSKLGFALGNAGVLYQNFCSPAARCIAVGAPGARDSGGTGSQKGAAYIGRPGDFSGNVSAGPFRVLGDNPGDYMGTGFASADLNADTIPELFVGQGGSATDSGLTSFFGGVGILLGAATAPSGPLTPLVFDRHFTKLDVDPVTGLKVETRIGGAMLATAADPVNQGGKITRLIVGAPGGQHLFSTVFVNPVPGRLHVFRRATFDY